MRLALDPRARRLLRRIPRSTVYTAMELLLLSLLAIQGARLIWTVLTPVGPVGDWKAQSALRPAALDAAALGDFDPFFRLSGDSGPIVVTSLDLKLFGVRENRATGRGSAIIGTPDGHQQSFEVGEEIVPGVMLQSVGFDGVVITRAGTAEQLFLDQSPPATVVAPVAGEEPGVAPAPAAAPPAASQIRFEPRMAGGAVTGIVVQPAGSGDAFRAAGFAPGDVILSVDGQSIRSAEDARRVAGDFGGGEASIQVERDGRVLTLRVGGEQ
jgi:general secretion pathway protein C